MASGAPSGRLAGLPALASPAGRTSAGLPVGIQIVGPHRGDDLVLDVAELLADVLLDGRVIGAVPRNA